MWWASSFAPAEGHDEHRPSYGSFKGVALQWFVWDHGAQRPRTVAHLQYDDADFRGASPSRRPHRGHLRGYTRAAHLPRHSWTAPGVEAGDAHERWRTARPTRVRPRTGRTP